MHLSDKQKKWADRMLKDWDFVVSNLTNVRIFNEHSLSMLLQRELTTRKRRSMLYRILARRNKLRNRREWDDIKRRTRRARKRY